MAEWEKVMDTIVSNASLRLKELGAEKTALQDQASNLQTSLKENEEQMQFHRNEIKKIIEEINLQTKHKFDQESAIFKNAEELNKLSKEIASMKEKVGITETNYNKEVQETNITHTENTEARKSDTEKDKAMLEGLRIENSNLTNYLEDKSAELQALTIEVHRINARDSQRIENTKQHLANIEDQFEAGESILKSFNRSLKVPQPTQNSPKKSPRTAKLQKV